MGNKLIDSTNFGFVEGATDADLVTLADRMTAAEQDIDTAEGNITDLQTRMTAAEGDIDTAEGNITDLQTRMTAAEGDIDTAEGNITDLQTRMTAAEGDIDAAEGNITNLQTRMTTAENDIDGVQADTADLKPRMTAVEAKAATNQANITDLRTRMTTAETNIATLQDKVEFKALWNSSSILTRATLWESSKHFREVIIGLKLTHQDNGETIEDGRIYQLAAINQYGFFAGACNIGGVVSLVSGKIVSYAADINLDYSNDDSYTVVDLTNTSVQQDSSDSHVYTVSLCAVFGRERIQPES